MWQLVTQVISIGKYFMKYIAAWIGLAYLPSMYGMVWPICPTCIDWFGLFVQHVLIGLAYLLNMYGLL